MLFDILDNIVPVVIIFMLFRGILTTILGKKERRPESDKLPDDYYDNDSKYEYDDEPPQEYRQLTPAEIFERKMRDKESAKEEKEHNGIGGTIVHDGTGTIYDGAVEKDGSSVRYDSDFEADGSSVLRDGPKERDGSLVRSDKPIINDYKPVHSDDCQIPHEKGNLYREYINKYAGAGSSSLDKATASLQVQSIGTKKKPRKRFKHAALVNGVIMEQILGKPRAFKPYGEED